MDQKAQANEINSLREAYTIICGVTRMPYVECSEEMDDQVFLFAKQEDADAFVVARKDKNLPLTVQKLEVGMSKGADGKPGHPINGVRGFLSQLPAINVDAVAYKRDNETETAVVMLENILPAGVVSHYTGNLYNPLLNLTALFFAQTARAPREKADLEELKITEEEFTANLVKAKLLLPVIPPEGEEIPKNGKPQSFDLSKCRHPVINLKDGGSYLPVFSDMAEMQKYTGGRPMGIIQVPFDQLCNFAAKEGSGFMFNPMSIALPLKLEQINGLLKRYGIEPKVLKAPEKPASQTEEKV